MSVVVQLGAPELSEYPWPRVSCRVVEDRTLQNLDRVSVSSDYVSQKKRIGPQGGSYDIPCDGAESSRKSMARNFFHAVIIAEFHTENPM